MKINAKNLSKFLDSYSKNKHFIHRRIFAIERARAVFFEEKLKTPFPECYDKLEKVFSELLREEVKGLGSLNVNENNVEPALNVRVTTSVMDAEELKRFIKNVKEIQKEYSCNCTLNVTRWQGCLFE